MGEKWRVYIMGSISIIELIISVVIFFIMFFGIGFILNMLLRMTWLMVVIYPIFVIFIVDEVAFLDYFFKAKTAFPALIDRFQALHIADVVILSSGMAGSVVAGIVMIILRKNGYRMF